MIDYGQEKTAFVEWSDPVQYAHKKDIQWLVTHVKATKNSQQR